MISDCVNYIAIIYLSQYTHQTEVTKSYTN